MNLLLLLVPPVSLRDVLHFLKKIFVAASVRGIPAKYIHRSVVAVPKITLPVDLLLPQRARLTRLICLPHFLEELYNTYLGTCTLKIRFKNTYLFTPKDNKVRVITVNIKATNIVIRITITSIVRNRVSTGRRIWLIIHTF